MPDNTAVRVALWRALHLEVDDAPPILDDRIGLAMAAPDEGWRSRPDMDPEATRLFRASIVARARFVEDMVEDKAAHGLGQYVILGAGLDSFAQRRPDIASRMRLFEIDEPETQAWKRQRLQDLGYGIPDWLALVPVDFEAGVSWRARLAEAGFDAARPALLAATGLSMYLTREAVSAMLREAAELAPGSTFVMNFILPMEFAAPQERSGRETSQKGAARSGTPFLSFFTPEDMAETARAAGFHEVQIVPAATLGARYFSGRTDGLCASPSEAFLVAGT
jgi:methyltransferase (TIGR00027 family)